MKIVVEVNDSKADFLMELLRNFSFVKKAEEMKKKNLSFLREDIREAVKEIKLAEEGKIKLKTAQELLDEL